MSSIMTNSAAMTALKSLQATNMALETTQSRISTGLKVGQASDNAAYWSIATTMRSDNKALGTVQDALGLGSAKVDVAYTGVNSAIDVVDEIKAKLVAAREPGVDRDKIQSEITELQNQLTSIATSSSFSGENWLSFDGTAQVKSVVGSFTRDGSGSVSVGTIDINISNVKLFGNDAAGTPANDGILNTINNYGSNAGDEIDISVATINISTAVLTDTLIDDAETGAVFTDILDEMISSVDAAISSMTTAAADLGASKGRIDMQTSFVSNLMDAIDRGVGTLVDADMTKESTRLSALQTQQQLGTQALAIANGSSQSILSLFR
ncbi:MAG: flagellin [Rhizobiaceae bacterium]|nr:flagellin [Rhizobiaceae bacterium]